MNAIQKSRTESKQPVLAVHIGRRVLRCLVMERNGDDLSASGSFEEVWQNGESRLSSAEGKQQLSKALKNVLKQVPKEVDDVYVSLSGEYCVTRVVNGENDVVLKEVRDIEARSHLYLSLGTGEKVVAGNIVQLDPRHMHATVSVILRESIESLLEITRPMGIRIVSMEPAVIALCRVMGAIQLDQAAPALVICAGTDSMEVAISYQGQLYLDYCPAGLSNPEDMAATLANHLERLQRYCRRHGRIMNRAIECGYLLGEKSLVTSIENHLRDKIGLPIIGLESVEMSQLAILGDVPVTHFSAAGVSMLASRKWATPGPNLMQRLDSDCDDSILPVALKVLGPLAASILIAVCVWSYLFYARHQVNQQLAVVQQLEPVRQEAIEIEHHLVQARNRLVTYQAVAQKLDQHDLGYWMKSLSQVLPTETWLTLVEVDSGGNLKLEGNSFDESGIFDYVDQLQQLPFVQRASLGGTIPTNTRVGQAIKFTIRCDLDESANDEELSNDSV